MTSAYFKKEGKVKYSSVSTNYTELVKTLRVSNFDVQEPIQSVWEESWGSKKNISIPLKWAIWIWILLSKSFRHGWIIDQQSTIDYCYS